MARQRGSRPGGINSLLDIIDEHGEALEADLMDAGLRLRDCPSERFNWRDLYVFVRYIGPHSRLYNSMYPKKAGWDLANLLLAAEVDELRWLHWAKLDPESRGDPPDPIPRPGVKEREVRPGSRTTPMTLEAGKKIFDRPDPERAEKLHKLFRGEK